MTVTKLRRKNVLRVAKTRETLREKTLESLRNAILNLHFESGERLIERDLCEQTGVSRTCVREALRCLESEGLVQTIPHKGPIVAVVTPEEAQQIYEVRKALETLACARFTERASTSDVRMLGRTVDDLEKAINDRDLAAALRANEEFYEMLFSGSRNEIAANLARSLRARVNYVRAKVISQWDPERSKPSLLLMRKIVAMIRKRDVGRAQKLFTEHLDHSEKIALKILQDQQEELKASA